VSGTYNAIYFTVGDWVISDGTEWAKVDNTDAVFTVFGRNGNILANAGDYTAEQITNVPAGNITATQMQAAINELDTEKAPAFTTQEAATVATTGAFADLVSHPSTLTGYGITDAVPEDTRGDALGFCGLDSGGKVPAANLPDSIVGQVVYQGVWAASTNTPAIPTAASGNKGWYYVASDNGTFNTVDYKTGDWIISNGTTWDKVDNTDAVATVFGRMGNILAVAGDYTAEKITNTPAGNIAATDVQAALNELDTEKEPAITQLSAAKGGTGVNGSALAINLVLASPSSGGAGAPTFRALVAADVPTVTLAVTATTANKIRTTAPGSPADGDIWMV